MKEEQPLKQVSRETAWAASAYAQRINGTLIDLVSDILPKSKDEVAVISNLQLMYNAMFYDSSVIQEQDYEFGNKVFDYHNKDLVLVSLTRELNEFDRHLLKALTFEYLTQRNKLFISIISKQIENYYRKKRIRNE